ncbi:MAG: antibiotic biosynthesis monooxygenase [Acidobacteria bacterium]|nr:antibiotic biosynthesis monooxygenase [Acidobacteriota bacterium]
MIIIAGSLTLNPAKRADALAVAAPLMTATHQEDGCIEYVMYADPNDDTKIGIFERWESEDALKAHFASPHMAEFQGKVGDFEVSAMDVTRYDATARDSLI